MYVIKGKKLSVDSKLFVLIFIITFTLFLFTTDAHRYTIDEDLAEQQSKRIATQMPDPTYVQGESRLFFEYPVLFTHNSRSICQNAILCSQANIGHSVTQVPFILINHNFHIITNDIKWTIQDFYDPHYVLWRNTLNPDFTFLELFYGPLFSALTVGVFFLVCRTFNFTPKTSVILALFYGLTTIAWAYSKTSLNSVPMTFFVLLGFLFFRKFQKTNSHIDLIFCSTSLGFAFLVRTDTVLLIIPLFLFILYQLKNQNGKIKKFFSFVTPTLSAYAISRIIDFIRVGIPQDVGSGMPQTSVASTFYQNIFGLFLSPGIGLLIFVPILFTIFLSFPDFYKRNKLECLLFLSFIMFFLIFYGNIEFWHGLNSWSARYLLPVVPFLLLPLGASIEKRKNKILQIFLIMLGGAGFLFNLVYVIQDVGWFVWGVARGNTGLYALGMPGMHKIWIDPVVIWTFEYSQLTHSIMWAFENLQPDIFLLKVLGAPLFGFAFVIIIVPFTYILLSLLKNKGYVQKYAP